MKSRSRVLTADSTISDRASEGISGSDDLASARSGTEAGASRSKEAEDDLNVERETGAMRREREDIEREIERNAIKY